MCCLFRRSLCPLVLLIALVGAFPTAARSQTQPAPLPGLESISQALTRQAGLEGRILWMDGTANLQRLSTRAGVASVLDQCVKANLNTVVVDVKPLSGHVLYDSKIAPHLREWKGFRYPAGYDLLRTALDEGHKRGLKVYASMNVFSDGHKLVHQGPIWEKPEQQCLIYDVERIAATPRGDVHRMAMGTNHAPGPDQISVYDSTLSTPRPVQNGEAFALVLGDRVERVGEAAQAPQGGINIPNDGYLLIGSGEGARWLLERVKPGDQLSWVANPKMVPIVDAPSETVAAFLNPAHPYAREYELKIAEEIAANYEVDGLVFDRMRYPSLLSDFSDTSRAQFESYLGKKVERWPADIYAYDSAPNRALIWGSLFKPWLEWRANVIRTWLEEADRRVHAKRPNAKTSVYVGSWYGTYYSVGVNWGSEAFQPGYEWMSAGYPRTGYAGLLDWITTGCYHPVATRDQAKIAGLDDSFTVQAAAELSSRAIGDVSFFYAGLYVQDYKGAPVAFREAMQAARDYSQGIMLFDLSQIEEYGYWPIIQETFREPATAPHDVPQLLGSVRAMKKALTGSPGGVKSALGR